MSKMNVKLFYNEVCKNEKLQNEIKDVIGGTLSEKNKQILLSNIAKKYNFDFTPEEAKKFAENLSKNELSLDDISEVSGGIGRRTAAIAFTALTALGSLGSAGAIISHASVSDDYNSSIKDLFDKADDNSASRPNLIVKALNNSAKAIEKNTNIDSYVNASSKYIKNTTNSKSKIDDLSILLENLYKKSEDSASNYVCELFENSNYEWYHKKGKDLCSYYLLKPKNDKKDNGRYCLALDGNRKVIFYKSARGIFNNDSYATEYLESQNLEQELHRRRLFRNALLNICDNTNNSEQLREWAQKLIKKILPDAERHMQFKDFYR